MLGVFLLSLASSCTLLIPLLDHVHAPEDPSGCANSPKGTAFVALAVSVLPVTAISFGVLLWEAVSWARRRIVRGDEHSLETALRQVAWYVRLNGAAVYLANVAPVLAIVRLHACYQL